MGHEVGSGQETPSCLIAAVAWEQRPSKRRPLFAAWLSTRRRDLAAQAGSSHGTGRCIKQEGTTLRGRRFRWSRSRFSTIRWMTSAPTSITGTSEVGRTVDRERASGQHGLVYEPGSLDGKSTRGQSTRPSGRAPLHGSVHKSKPIGPAPRSSACVSSNK